MTRLHGGQVFPAGAISHGVRGRAGILGVAKQDHVRVLGDQFFQADLRPGRIEDAAQILAPGLFDQGLMEGAGPRGPRCAGFGGVQFIEHQRAFFHAGDSFFHRGDAGFEILDHGLGCLLVVRHLGNQAQIRVHIFKLEGVGYDEDGQAKVFQGLDLLGGGELGGQD